MAKGADSVRSAAEAAAGRVRGGATAGAGAGRTHRAPKRKSPAVALASIALLVILAVGSWYLYDQSKKGGMPTRAGEQAQTSAETTTDLAAANAPPVAPPPADPIDTEPAAPPAAEAAPPKPAPPPKGPPVDDIVLLDLPLQAPIDGTTPEEIEQMEGWMESILDINAGAKGSRALKSMEAMDKKAYPFVLNALRRLDLYVEDDKQNGMRLQRLLQDIANGSNFGWKDTTEVEDVIYNKKAVRAWFRKWEQVREDDAEWAKFAKTDRSKGTDGSQE